MQSMQESICTNDIESLDTDTLIPVSIFFFIEDVQRIYYLILHEAIVNNLIYTVHLIYGLYNKRLRLIYKLNKNAYCIGHRL